MKLERRSFIKLAGLLAVPAMPALGFGGSSTDDAAFADDTTLLNPGLKKQLFFDDLLIESVQDITREFHQPANRRRILSSSKTSRGSTCFWSGPPLTAYSRTQKTSCSRPGIATRDGRMNSFEAK